MLETEAGATLRAWLADQPVVAAGPGWLVVDLRAGKAGGAP